MLCLIAVAFAVGVFLGIVFGIAVNLDWPTEDMAAAAIIFLIISIIILFVLSISADVRNNDIFNSLSKKSNNAELIQPEKK